MFKWILKRVVLVSLVIWSLSLLPISSKQMYHIYVLNGGKVMLEQESFSPPVVRGNVVEFNGITVVNGTVSFSAMEIPWK
jgi:hypothetical protein